MKPANESALTDDGGSPINNFTDSHEGIISNLKSLGEVPSLLEPALRAKAIAEKTLNFFRPAVFDHHREEEKDLFPAVLAAAEKGAERDKVKAMADSLTAEHRVIEAIWRELEPQLSKLASGHIGLMDTALVDHLVEKYQAHAMLEEQHFLPLAEVILRRKDPQMAELALSLHMRHVVRAARRGLRAS